MESERCKVEDFKFDFEELEVYQRTLNFVNKVFEVTGKFIRSFQFSLGDQFRRASLSIINNIAEGSGKQSQDDKKRFYKYSLDSARECIPMITISLSQRQIDQQMHNALREDCIIICRMLAKLISATK